MFESLQQLFSEFSILEVIMSVIFQVIQYLQIFQCTKHKNTKSCCAKPAILDIQEELKVLHQRITELDLKVTTEQAKPK